MSRIAIFLALALAGFVSLLFWQAREPAGTGGGFDPIAFFEGTSVSTGSIATALVLREDFTAAFVGERDGDTLRLEERFSFADGERLQVWTLRIADGTLSGTVETERADGELATPVPVAGRSDADGVVLSYEGIAPGGGTSLHFTHRMRRTGEETVANHVVVAKFGIPLATSSVTFAKDASALPSLTRGR